MNEIERTIRRLNAHIKFYLAKKFAKNSTIFDATNTVIKALEEKQEIDSLIQEYDTDCTAKDIVKSFIQYVKAEDNELAGFRILTNADKEDYESWKRSKDKGCEYCAEDKCRLCTLLCDYWGDGGTDKCSAEGNADPCSEFSRN